MFHSPDKMALRSKKNIQKKSKGDQGFFVPIDETTSVPSGGGNAMRPGTSGEPVREPTADSVGADFYNAQVQDAVVQDKLNVSALPMVRTGTPIGRGRGSRGVTPTPGDPFKSTQIETILGTLVDRLDIVDENLYHVESLEDQMKELIFSNKIT